MHRPGLFALPLAVMVGAALSSCGGPPGTSAPRAAPALTDQWQRVAIASSEKCSDRLACLIGLSGVDNPTVVSIKKVPFPSIQGVEACMPKALAPGLGPDAISFQAYTSESLQGGVAANCPAYGEDRKSPQHYVEWRRADSREYFEGQNPLGYSFLPLGSSVASGAQHVRCIVLYDPSEASGPLPSMKLQSAAEVCLTLFYFRERE